MARCPMDYCTSFVLTVRQLNKRKHSPCFVGGSAMFLCFIFSMGLVREPGRAREFNRLIIIDKVMQGGIIGRLFL